MSDAVQTLDLAEQLARIERAQEETRKFAAEQNKLAEEALKLQQEARKFQHEALKFQRERWLPVAALLTGVGGLLAGLIAVVKAFGL